MEYHSSLVSAAASRGTSNQRTRALWPAGSDHGPVAPPEKPWVAVGWRLGSG
jgi:hypothetical protein